MSLDREDRSFGTNMHTNIHTCVRVHVRVCMPVCVCALRTINASLELSADRTRADSHVSAEITWKNNLPKHHRVLYIDRADIHIIAISVGADQCQSHSARSTIKRYWLVKFAFAFLSGIATRSTHISHASKIVESIKHSIFISTLIVTRSSSMVLRFYRKPFPAMHGALLKKTYRFAKHTVRLRDGNMSDRRITMFYESMNLALSSVRYKFLHPVCTNVDYSQNKMPS